MSQDKPHATKFGWAMHGDAVACAIEIRMERSGLSAEITPQAADHGLWTSIPLWRYKQQCKS